MHALRLSFASSGSGIQFDPDGTYSFENIHVGDGANLGVRPTMIAGVANIWVGRKVMFGPEVLVVAGGHNITASGRFMADVSEKDGDEDLGVVIGDDCWIGARAMIMRGVDIGRGSVVGAGSLVTRSLPPYSVAVGNPVEVTRYRFSVAQALAHERSLYADDERLTALELAHLDGTPRTFPRRETAV